MTAADLPVMYSQIAVFNAGLENPFNDWSDAHVAQGFSWREDAVSFRTLADGVVTHVEQKEDSVLNTSPAARRIISVPFRCTSGSVEIATIGAGFEVHVAPGDYQLVFQAGEEDDSYWCSFTFIRDGDAEPSIIVADDDLSPAAELVMSARPA